eukprot:3933658-Amphidinium_carterae.2
MSKKTSESTARKVHRLPARLFSCALYKATEWLLGCTEQHLLETRTTGRWCQEEYHLAHTTDLKQASLVLGLAQ